MADPVQMYMRFVTNLASGSPVRRETLNGRAHLVAPCAMLTEGVFEGSNGPIFYPGKENAKSVPTWNNKPVVVYHPSIDGKGVAADSPEVLEKWGIGILLRTSNDSKLRTEAWLDEEKTKKVDERVHEAVVKNQMVEVSTGLFLDALAHEPRSFNGRKYELTATNYRPDHLAVLPDKIGACSIADGAGLLQLNEATLHGPQRVAFKVLQEAAKQAGLDLTDNQLSFSDVTRQLTDLIAAKVGLPGKEWYGWVCEVYPGFAIYRDADNKMYSVTYKVGKSEQVELTGEPVEVVRVTEYQRLDGSPVGNSKPKEKSMDKKAHVDALIANGGWAEEDRVALMAMPDAQLAKIKPAPKADPPKVDPPAPVMNSPAVTPPVTTPAPLSPQQWLDMAPPQLKQVWNESMDALKTEMETHINAITANSNNVFTKEQLASMPISQLRGLAKLAAKPPEQPAVTVNHAGLFPPFWGQAAPAPVVNAEAKVTPMVAPSLFTAPPAPSKN